MRRSAKLLLGLVVAVGLGVALSMVGIVHAQRSQQRIGSLNSVTEPLAPGFQACSQNFLPLPNFVSTATGTVATVALATASAVTVTFSTEIFAPPGVSINLDYSIDGGGLTPIGPEFFSADNPFFVTRTARGVTLPPFTGPLPAGIHTIQPFLTAFGGDGAGADWRCFTAEP